ncbi:hypothetical protein ACKKBG_A26720 [Auxenochlorella protothecoides x Auxenochlorella symbiontica]
MMGSPCPPEASTASQLPEHLLENIFSYLQGGRKKHQFSVCGVCRSWRRVGQQIFFARPWDCASVLCHPSQLFHLSPRPVRGSKSGLLKCFVRREPAAHGAGGPRRFSLWLGRDPTSPGANPARTRFLLAALQSSRSDTAFFTSGRADAPPCAQLGTNVFATRYILTAGPSPQGEGLLAELQYRARVKGFMQPRRLQVTLPQPPPPQAGLPVAAGPSPRVSPQASSRSWVSVDSVASLGGADAPRWGTTGPGERPLGPARKTGPSAREEQQQPSGSGRVSRFLFRLAALPSRAPRHRPPDLLPEDAAPIQLQNNAPTWNSGLRCWCLNFRGRVKLASVKNFQLVDTLIPGGPVIMQFGKVDQDIYILDFNPMRVNALQAFAVALSTFDSKIML